MKSEILKRTYWQKIKIICKLYFVDFILIILSILLLLFVCSVVPEEIKSNILQHKKNLLEISSTNFKNIALFFISIVVGSYSIVQALLDEESLKILTISSKKETSKFTYINIYFYTYVIILLLIIVLNGGIELGLKFEKELNFIAKLKLKKELLDYIFIIIFFSQISLIISISYEFSIFIRNLYDTFKVTTFIKMTKKMSSKEKILIINEYLFNRNKINYLSLELTDEAYKKMKLIIGKDFTLDEAIIYIKTNN